MAEDDARGRFDLDLGEAAALGGGEEADLLGGTVDVVAELARHRGGGALDLALGEGEAARAPVVEALGVAAHRLGAVALDVGEDAGDDLGDLGVGGDRRAVGRLQEARHRHRILMPPRGSRKAQRAKDPGGGCTVRACGSRDEFVL